MAASGRATLATTTLAANAFAELRRPLERKLGSRRSVVPQHDALHSDQPFLFVPSCETRTRVACVACSRRQVSVARFGGFGGRCRLERDQAAFECSAQLTGVLARIERPEAIADELFDERHPARGDRPLQRPDTVREREHQVEVRAYAAAVERRREHERLRLGRDRCQRTSQNTPIRTRNQLRSAPAEQRGRLGRGTADQLLVRASPKQPTLPPDGKRTRRAEQRNHGPYDPGSQRRSQRKSPRCKRRHTRYEVRPAGHERLRRTEIACLGGTRSSLPLHTPHGTTDSRKATVRIRAPGVKKTSIRRRCEPPVDGSCVCETRRAGPYKQAAQYPAPIRACTLA